MYQDETLVCLDCGKEFIFSASEQALRRKASRTSRAVARSAVRPIARRMEMDARSAKCLRRFARTAARRRRFPSSPAATNRSIAVTALQRIAP